MIQNACAWVCVHVRVCVFHKFMKESNSPPEQAMPLSRSCLVFWGPLSSEQLVAYRINAACDKLMWSGCVHHRDW